MPRRKREKTTLIRIRESTHKRAKIQAARQGKSVVDFIEEKLNK